MSECHSSARCDEGQQVFISGVLNTVTVHNVHGVKGYTTLLGFAKNEDGSRTHLRKLADDPVWREYTGLGL